MRQAIADHIDELVRAGLEVAPQTNEVGRSAALLAGLFDLAGSRRHQPDPAARGRSERRPEPAGRPLRLRWSRLAVGSPGLAGPAARGDRGAARPAALVIVEPARLRPGPGRRHHRRRPAAAHLVRLAVRPRAAPAAGWSARAGRSTPGANRPGGGEHLARDPAARRRTIVPSPVVWHSITQLYWPPAEIAAVRRIVDTVGRDHPIGRVGLEFDPAGPRGAMPEISTELWRPGQPTRSRRLGTAHHHGVPVRLGSARD